MHYYHENPHKLHINTEMDRSYFISFPVTEDPFDNRENSGYFTLLNGDWDFSYYSSFDEIKDCLGDRLPKMDFPESIRVPGNIGICFMRTVVCVGDLFGSGATMQ